MKRFVGLLAGLLMLMATGTAMAITLPSGFNWVNAPFWTNSDTSTANSQFQLVFEGFSGPRDASFGLFYVNDTNNPANPTKFEIFSKSDEPSSLFPGTQKTVSFQQAGNTFQAKLNNGSWVNFSNIFGFYFDFDGGGQVANQSYFSAYSLDSVNDNIRNVFTAIDPYSQTLIYLDRFATTSGISAAEVQMQIFGNDLIPTPEPGTMVLLGLGLAGLGFFGRKRIKA